MSKGGPLPPIAPPSGLADTSDLNVLRRAEIQSIFTQSTPSGDRQINGIKLPVLSGQKLNISGDAYIYGIIKTPLQIAKGIRFPDGSATEPSISFINDPDTGIYRDGDGNVNFTSNGAPTIIVGTTLNTNIPITTTMGNNLILNPDGPSVDFSGKTLINVGGISLDPNRYEVIGMSVTTLNVVPTVALTITTVNDAAYHVRADIALAHVTDGTSSGGFSVTTKAKNIGGTVSTVAPYISSEYNLDPALNGCTVAFMSSGSDINVVVTGIAATVNWRAAAVITRQLY